jgi:hypothetical protein
MTSVTVQSWGINYPGVAITDAPNFPGDFPPGSTITLNVGATTVPFLPPDPTVTNPYTWNFFCWNVSGASVPIAFGQPTVTITVGTEPIVATAWFHKEGGDGGGNIAYCHVSVSMMVQGASGDAFPSTQVIGAVAEDQGVDSGIDATTSWNLDVNDGQKGQQLTIAPKAVPGFTFQSWILLGAWLTPTSNGLQLTLPTAVQGGQAVTSPPSGNWETQAWAVYTANLKHKPEKHEKIEKHEKHEKFEMLKEHVKFEAPKEGVKNEVQVERIPLQDEQLLDNLLGVPTRGIEAREAAEIVSQLRSFITAAERPAGGEAALDAAAEAKSARKQQKKAKKSRTKD